MTVARLVRASATGAVLALALGALTTTAAEAKPTKPGGTSITVSATEPAIGTYDVSVAWSAVTGATSYRTSISRSGTTLATGKVATPAWTAKVPAYPGQQLTVSVQAVVGTRKGRPTTTTYTLKDQIAPTASYTSAWSDSTGQATLTEVGLKDDSPTGEVTRTVDWGDGTTLAYAAGQPITHTYGLTAARYVPQVTLKDAAGNTSQVDAAAVVIDDTQAPTGSFGVDVASAWASYSTVTLSQSALSDNWTPAGLIVRTVHWGDGSVQAWTSGTTLTHVYKSAGSFTPAVQITDEAHNSATIPTSAVVVTADTTGPKVTLRLPRSRHSVRAWRTLRGSAVDSPGTGVAKVTVRAVEKRGTAWYGYRATTRTWVKATTKAKAFAKARAFTLATDAADRWSAKLARLRKGTLVYRVKATDHVGNVSATFTHQAKLTRS